MFSSTLVLYSLPRCPMTDEIVMVEKTTILEVFCKLEITVSKDGGNIDKIFA
jgi:hypothetical protein